MHIKLLKLKYKIVVFLLIIGSVFFYFLLPKQLFKEPVSVVVLDKNGFLLGAKISKDEQWRFPPSQKLAPKIATCIVQFEDKRFYHHPGIDPLALVRAAYLDIKHLRVVSGGSTISMQVIRLMRKGKRRTVYEKIVEMFLALRLECRYTKDKILALYGSYAPMGGNIVGIDAAAWKYFETSARNLSWAQAASLAVLPNAPSLIHPGKHRNAFLKKRNRLLKRLYDKKIISQEDYELALDEDLPSVPHALPHKATQLIDFVEKKQRSEQIAIQKTAIDGNLQDLICEILKNRSHFLFANHIYNAGVLVADVASGKVLAYVGNIPGTPVKAANQVDMIQGLRSTGSVLKPILYASVMQSGDYLPHSLVPDIPIQFGGFMPKNYNRNYSGAVPADRALARSLNIPAVLMLKHYGIQKFYSKLKQMGMTSLGFPAEHYGLSLILGGSDASLWELVGIYASMARVLDNYAPNNGKYYKEDIHPLIIDSENNRIGEKHELANPVLPAGGIYYAFKAMLELERPSNENSWQTFSSSQRIAWKTGTSFGFRDAWSIGVTPKYVVGVWVGNANGEGRPDLIGIRVAAPILFQIFRLLPVSREWFELPADELIPVITCHKTGFLAGEFCDKKDTLLLLPSAEHSQTCPYHHPVHLSKDGKYQVNSTCANPDEMQHRNWFILPPVMEYFYKKEHPEYEELPPFSPKCRNITENSHNIQMIYPKANTKVYIPIDFNGKPSRVIFRAAHRQKNATLFWYIDNKLYATTTENHEIEVLLSPAKYKLTLIDNYGEQLVIPFEVVRK